MTQSRPVRTAARQSPQVPSFIMTGNKIWAVLARERKPITNNQMETLALDKEISEIKTLACMDELDRVHAGQSLREGTQLDEQ